MALTRDFKETVSARVSRDPAFAKALLDEAATLTKTPSKSLHRMLSERGNPSMDNLAAIFGVVRKRLGVNIRAHAVKAAWIAPSFSCAGLGKTIEAIMVMCALCAKIAHSSRRAGNAANRAEGAANNTENRTANAAGRLPNGGASGSASAHANGNSVSASGGANSGDVVNGATGTARNATGQAENTANGVVSSVPGQAALLGEWLGHRLGRRLGAVTKASSS